jgi:hypothetical protein
VSSNVLTQYCGVFKKVFMTTTMALGVIHKACLPAPPIFRRIDHLRFDVTVVIK